MNQERRPNLAKIWKKEDIDHDSEAGISISVLLNAQRAVVKTLNQLGFKGEAPILILKKGGLLSKAGEEQAALFDPTGDLREIVISEKGLNFVFAGPGLPVEVKVLLVAAQMTVFYVQFHESQGGSDWRPTEKQLEETKRISVLVANDILGYIQFSFEASE